MTQMILSDLFLSDANYGVAVEILSFATPLNQAATVPAALNSGTITVTFWKGAIPTNSEQNGFINTSRASDALLRFSGSNTISRSGKRLTCNFGTSSFGTLLATGTITWFNIGNADSNVNRPLAFGTVGLTGSGADLELPKVDVVTNDLWLCTNLYFDVNNVMTFA